MIKGLHQFKNHSKYFYYLIVSKKNINGNYHLPKYHIIDTKMKLKNCKKFISFGKYLVYKMLFDTAVIAVYRNKFVDDLTVGQIYLFLKLEMNRRKFNKQWINEDIINAIKMRENK